MTKRTQRRPAVFAKRSQRRRSAWPWLLPNEPNDAGWHWWLVHQGIHPGHWWPSVLAKRSQSRPSGVHHVFPKRTQRMAPQAGSASVVTKRTQRLAPLTVSTKRTQHPCTRSARPVFTKRTQRPGPDGPCRFTKRTQLWARLVVRSWFLTKRTQWPEKVPQIAF